MVLYREWTQHIGSDIIVCTGNLSIDIFDTSPESLQHRMYIVLMAMGAIIIIRVWLKNKVHAERQATR